MRYRQQDKGGNLFSALKHQQAVSKREIGILKLRDLIDWESFRPLLEELCGYTGRDWSKGGQPPFDPVFMLKVLILQKYHGLSDDATEEQIGDRLSFLNFLGLQLGDDIPDAKTIWDFKQRLEQDERQGSCRLFEAFTASSKANVLRNLTTSHQLDAKKTVMPAGRRKTIRVTMGIRTTPRWT